jgi:hypothetical protein
MNASSNPMAKRASFKGAGQGLVQLLVLSALQPERLPQLDLQGWAPRTSSAPIFSLDLSNLQPHLLLFLHWHDPVAALPRFFLFFHSPL